MSRHYLFFFRKTDLQAVDNEFLIAPYELTVLAVFFVILMEISDQMA